MLHRFLKIPKSDCPDIWTRLPKHKMAHIMVQYGRSWSSFGRTIMGKAIWESSVRPPGKSSKLRMLIGDPRKRTILVCVCGRYQNGRQERNKIWTQCGRYLWKTLMWENRHRSLTMFLWVAWEQKKSCLVQGNRTRTFPHGPVTLWN